MIKLYHTTILLFVVLLSVNAQQTEPTLPLRKNEIRADLIRPLLENINISYERRISEYYSAGAVLNIRTGYKFTLTNEYETKNQHHLFLFGRLYPFRKYLYVEGFSGLTTSRGRPIERIITDNGFLVFRRTLKTFADLAVGGAIGVKIAPKRHPVTVDFTVGFGKNLLGLNTYSDAIFRGGIALGYTF